MEPDETAREEAKRFPNGYVYVIDRNIVSDPNGAVPPQAIKGAWKVDGNGQIVGDFIANANYQPDFVFKQPRAARNPADS